MATTKEVIELLIRADAKGAAKELDAIGSSTKKLGKDSDKLARLSGNLTRFGATAVGVSAVATAGLFKLAGAASEVSEQLSATEVNFGDASDSVAEFAKEASRTAGIAQSDALRAANRFAAFGRQAGLSGEQLAGFSTQLVQTAGDLASFVDINVEDALTAIASGLAGEQEALRRYGVDVSNAALQNEIFEQTGREVTGTLTAQQKVFAANIRIQEDLAVAQGDFVRTGDSLANQQRRLAAEFKNTQAALGDGLSPVFGDMIGQAADLLEAFNGLDGSTQKIVGQIGGLATVGVGVTGVLALIGGQAIKTKTAMDAAGISVGKFARGVGGIGLLVVAYEGMTSALSFLEDQLDNTLFSQEALNDAFQEGSFRAQADDIIDAIDGLDGWQRAVRDAFDLITLGRAGTRKELDAVNKQIEQVEVTLRELALTLEDDAWRLFKEQLISSASGAEELELVLRLVADAESAAAEAAESGAIALGEEGDAFRDLTDEVETAIDKHKEFSDLLRGLTDPFFAVANAESELAEARASSAEALKEHGANSAEYAAAVRGERDAALDARDAQGALLAQVQDGSTTYDQAIADLSSMRDSGYLTVEAFDALAFQVLVTALAVEKNSGKDFDVNEEPAKNSLGAVETASITAREAVTRNSNPRFDVDTSSAVSKLGQLVNLSIRAREAATAASQGGTQNPLTGGALGGRARAGEPMWVGEVGKEIFVPDVDGTIIPNHQLPMGHDGATIGGGAVHRTYQINVSALDPRAARDAVMEAVFEYETANGSGWRD